MRRLEPLAASCELQSLQSARDAEDGEDSESRSREERHQLYGSSSAAARSKIPQLDTTRYNSIQLDTTRYNSIQLDTTRYNSTKPKKLAQQIPIKLAGASLFGSNVTRTFETSRSNPETELQSNQVLYRIPYYQYANMMIVVADLVPSIMTERNSAGIDFLT